MHSTYSINVFSSSCRISVKVIVIAYTFIMHRISVEGYIKEVAKFTSGREHLGSGQEIHYFSVYMPF